jgi:transcriptional regulator with XRE-family HTH domain
MMLNKALRLMRVFNDLSQKELAEKLGISKSLISEIESGKKNSTIELLNKYSNFFDIPVSSIFFSRKDWIIIQELRR